MDEKERTQDEAIVRKALDILSEHFDSVQVFVSRHEPAIANGTISISMGSGNWFTRYGQVITFLEQASARNSQEGVSDGEET